MARKTTHEHWQIADPEQRRFDVGHLLILVGFVVLMVLAIIFNAPLPVP